jgi:hypothetical protein
MVTREGAQVAKWLKVAGLAVVALLVAASASGDSNTYNYQGTGPYFNTKSGQVVDATGNAKVVDADRDRDLVLGQNQIISATITAASAESSITFPVGNARHITLWIKASPAVGTNALLAVQLRLHLSSASDSTSIGAWSPRYGANSFIAAGPDTVGDTRLNAGASYSDEIAVFRSGARRSAGNAGAFNWNTLIPITYTLAPGAGSYFSVRVRNAGAGSCGVVVHYRASAL